jgi:ubiquinone/menaquinone biosynthesis C-methylase UbiE
MPIQSPYKLPFDDNTFDFIYTSQVFEHIQDYSITLSEMARILKPNGFSLNIFPPKWRWIEPHVYVPLAGAIQKKWWLTLWAYLGVKNQFQESLTPLEIAQINYYYLTHSTNYLSTQTIYDLSKHFFREVKFCELYKFKYSRYSSLYLLPLLLRITFLLQAYLCNFNMKVLFLKK